ncbi:MAG: acyl-CoA thioesterase [Limisphaerales bacterium]
MPSSFSVIRSVEFSETDMAGIMHYSNFFRFMEAAEHAFFRSIGFSVAARPGAPKVGWPRVHASCDYFRPLRFEDRVEIRMDIVEKRSKSLAYEFRFFRIVESEGSSAAGREEVAKGRLTVVCVAHQPDGTMKAAAIPSEIADHIEVSAEAATAIASKASPTAAGS